MACFHPLNIPHPTFGVAMTVPCGQCIGCRLERSRQWAVRCMHERSLHEDACFLTLTYSPEHLPENDSLNKEHMTLFIKRLRKAIEPLKIRFFQCGEYGEQTQRPHHHMLLFGYEFPDRQFFSKKQDCYYYTSPQLDKLWTHGLCVIGNITFDSAAYVARYCVDKLTGELGKREYEDKGRIPPYVTMSRRPGIGAGWFDKYSSDAYPSDEIVVRGKATCKPPKYYDKLLEKMDAEMYKMIKADRVEAAESNPDFNNWKRLKVKQTIAEQRLKNLTRTV